MNYPTGMLLSPHGLPAFRTVVSREKGEYANHAHRSPDNGAVIAGVLWSIVCGLQIAGAIFLVFYGSTHLSGATEGVGVLMMAGVAIVFARIAQAGANHAWLTDEIRQLRIAVVAASDDGDDDSN